MEEIKREREREESEILSPHVRFIYFVFCCCCYYCCCCCFFSFFLVSFSLFLIFNNVETAAVICNNIKAIYRMTSFINNFISLCVLCTCVVCDAWVYLYVYMYYFFLVSYLISLINKRKMFSMIDLIDPKSIIIMYYVLRTYVYIYIYIKV